MSSLPTVRPRLTRTVSDALRRLLATAAATALVAAAAVALPAPAAQAAITTPFAPRFSTNTNGDVLIRGNTLMTCPASTACTGAQNRTASGTALNNNSYAMRFVDVDADPATRSSSSADVQLADDTTVLFAGLYWSAYTTGGTPAPAGTAPNRLLLKAPGSDAYTTVTGTTTTASTGAGTAYQSFADVTSIVAGARGGTYTAADIAAASGATDRYGAWSLVLAVSGPQYPARNLTVFDGWGTVQNTPASERALTIPVSGFVTPSVAPVTTRLGSVVYEGDAGLVGDTFSLTRQDGTVVPLSNSLNPETNVFNSSVTDAGAALAARNPAYSNLMGMDADVFQGQFVAPGDTSATLTLATGGETFYPGVVTFATDLYAPALVAEKSQTVVDVDSDGATGPGDRIDYAVDVTNTGRDAAVRTTFGDAIPLGTTYRPGTLAVDGVPQTDAADGDRAEAGPGITARLGTNPGTTGGRLAVGATTRVTFSVDVGETLTDGAEIANQATLGYVGQNTGQQLSGASNRVVTPYSAPRSDLRVLKTADTAVVQRDGSRALTYTISVVNDGPDPDAGVVLSDPLPAGFTATSVDGPGCAAPSATVTCDLGALAVGQTATVVVTGVVAADAPASLVNVATATGSSVDPTPVPSEPVTTVVNTPPVAVPDTATVPGGAGSSVPVPVLGNDSDPDGDPLTVVTAGVTPPAHGAVTVGPDGSLVYTVTDPTFAGDDVVTYVVCDPSGACATTTVTVTVGNQPPVAVDDSTGTGPGVPVTVDVAANDSDPNGDPLVVEVLGQPTGGTATVVDGQVLVTPDAGFRGDLVIPYQVCDPQGACATATLVVTVDDAAPVAVDDRTTTPFETPVTIPDADLLANDSDPNPGDVLTVVSVQDAVGGTVTRGADGATVFTPAPGFTGTASFTYTVTDGTATSTATVYVDVPNTPPTAVDDRATTSGGAPVSVPVLDNDSDVESPTSELSVVITDAPADGFAQVVDGQVVYTPPSAAFKGTETIGYQVCDPQGLCDTAVVTVVVANQAPVALPDARTVDPGGSVRIPVRDNDSDPNGDALSIPTIATPPAQGSVEVDPVTGELVFTPAPGQVGDVTFSYQVCDDDPEPLCATAEVTVTVLPEPPLARSDAVFVQHQAGVPTVVAIDVLAGDLSPSGQPLTVVEVSQPPVGSAVIVDNQVVVTAPPGFVGELALTYLVTDPQGLTSSASILVTVGNRAPTAADDQAVASAGLATPIDVLANDADPDADPLTITAGTPSGGGTAAVVDGQLVFTSDGTLGTFEVPYTACDPYGACAEAVATVVVEQAPAQVPPTFTGEGRQTVTVGDGFAPVTATTPDGAPLTFTVVSGTLPPGTALQPDGTVTGTTTTAGTSEVVLRVCRASGECTDGTYVFEVLPLAPGAPVPPGTGGGSGSRGDRLPRTGAEVAGLGGLGALLLAGGAVLVAGSRRRRRG